MTGITPNRDAFIRLAKSDSTEPVVMLNLLKYKAGGGEERYSRYGATAAQLIEQRGGKVLWSGTPFDVLIGDEDADAWDAVVLVEYPSAKAFIDMIQSPTYNEAHGDREAGLERTRLIPMRPRS